MYLVSIFLFFDALSPLFTQAFSTISLLFVDRELSFQLKGQGPLQGGAMKKDCEEVELVG